MHRPEGSMAKKKLELGTISGSPRQLALAEFRRRCTNENRVCAKQFRGRRNEVYGPREEQGPTRSKAKVEGNHLTTNYFHFRLCFTTLSPFQKLSSPSFTPMCGRRRSSPSWPITTTKRFLFTSSLYLSDSFQQILLLLLAVVCRIGTMCCCCCSWVE